MGNKYCNCIFQFFDVQYLVGLFDHDLSSINHPVKSTTWDDELLNNCVAAICHHSSLEEYSKRKI